MAVPTKYLEFKFLKNVMIDLGDMQQYIIPMEMRMQDNPAPTRNMANLGMKKLNGDDPGAQILLPDFNLNFVHKIKLQDELPAVPKRMPGMGDTFYEKLCETSYEKAARAKIFNDVIRAKVASYAKNGTILVTADPFENEVVIEGLEELAESLKAADAFEAEKEPKSAPTVVESVPAAVVAKKQPKTKE